MLKIFAILTIVVLCAAPYGDAAPQPPATLETATTVPTTMSSANNNDDTIDLTGADTFGLGYYGAPVSFYGYGSVYYPRPRYVVVADSGGYGYGYDYGRRWGYQHPPTIPVWG